jgi:hypothetical protein
MLYINEWFPNPVGNDNAGEFVELYNSGVGGVDLGGYSLSDGIKKKFSLAGYTIAPNGYLVLKKAESKLALKNTDGALLLYGPNGQIVDEASFTGVAPEGKSFSRVDYGNASIEHFAFVYPTPGAANRTIDTTVSVTAYPSGVPLAREISAVSFLFLTIGVATSFLLLFIYVTHHNRNISDLFFGGDVEVGP